VENRRFNIFHLTEKSSSAGNVQILGNRSMRCPTSYRYAVECQWPGIMTMASIWSGLRCFTCQKALRNTSILSINKLLFPLGKIDGEKPNHMTLGM
jgi:hypothetical protein